jgi:hypothetical protein
VSLPLPTFIELMNSLYLWVGMNITAFLLEELSVITLLLDEEQEANKIRCKWVHDAWQKRNATLLTEFVGD